MRLTIALLGLELDITLGPAGADDEDQPDTGAALNGGTAASTPVGFVHRHDVPEEVPFPQRVPPWDDEE